MKSCCACFWQLMLKQPMVGGFFIFETCINTYTFSTQFSFIRDAFMIRIKNKRKKGIQFVCFVCCFSLFCLSDSKPLPISTTPNPASAVKSATVATSMDSGDWVGRGYKQTAGGG